MSRDRPARVLATILGLALGLGLVGCGGSEGDASGAVTTIEPSPSLADDRLDDRLEDTEDDPVDDPEDDASDDDAVGTTVVPDASPVAPVGFGTIAARVVSDAGEPCDVCLWVADTDGQRGRGLMGVNDLGGRDGMAFVYHQPRTTSFTMRNTLLPLTIVFYGPDGRYLDAFDMEPCTAEPCTSYPTPRGFTVAVEVPRGDATRLGMVPGSELALAGDCETPSSH